MDKKWPAPDCHDVALLEDNLATASEKIVPYLEPLESWQQEFQLYYTQIWAQYLANLQGNWVNPKNIDGEIFDRFKQYY